MCLQGRGADGCALSVYLNLSEGQSFYLGRSSAFPDVEVNISAVQIPDQFQGQREYFPTGIFYLSSGLLAGELLCSSPAASQRAVSRRNSF